MSYQIGVDLGTTYTAAAIYRDERASIFSLGGRAAAIPSVVLLREDETVLVGEAAVRRAMTEPERVAREFKRRLGDTTPIIVGGTPYSAEALMSRLLRHVLDEVSARESGPPDRVAVSHPANWGPFKIDLLQQAIRMAGLEASDVVLVTEPEAAAISYASQERVELGEVIAVYDLGGGTFDTAVLRRTSDGFEIIGQPEGIERLGGIDFDAAVFAHVVRSLDGAIESLDQDDPATLSAVSRLRQDCVDAKEALSDDTDATIPVLLPGLQTEVRLTRQEFEAIVRPSLVDSIEALRRALRSAGVDASQVARVLLVGGSSRVPLIGQLVSSELGRPVAVDAHPKHAIALGAALAAADGPARGVSPEAPPQSPQAQSPQAQSPQAQSPQAQSPHSPQAPMAAAAPIAPTPTPTPAAASPVPTDTRQTIPLDVPATAAAAPMSPAPAEPAPTPTPAATQSPPAASGGSRLPFIIGIGLVCLVALGGLGYLLTRDTGGNETATTEAPTSSDTEAPSTTATAAESTTTTAAVEARTDEDITSELLSATAGFDLPDLTVTFADGVASLVGTALDEENESEILTAVEGVEGVDSVNTDGFVVLAVEFRCTDAITSQPRWLCIESAEFDGTSLVATFISEDGGAEFNTGGGFHVHFYNGANDAVNQGVAGDASVGGGDWQVWDLTPLYETDKFAGTDIEMVCGRIATPSHTLESLESGNCWPVTRTDG